MEERKRELRRRAAAVRDAMPPAERAAASRRIAERAIAAWESGLFAWGAGPDGERPLRLAAYVAFRSEADAAGLTRWCRARGIPVAAPRVDAAGTMTLRAIAGEHELMPGTFGILEPGPDAPPAPLAPGTLALVPGLAFDAAGGRLGYGGGYYDRLLAGHRADIDAGAIVLAGVAFAAQVTRAALPAEPHDVRMRFLLTEEAIIDCRTGEAV